jgi:hypothetical protein
LLSLAKVAHNVPAAWRSCGNIGTIFLPRTSARLTPNRALAAVYFFKVITKVSSRFEYIIITLFSDIFAIHGLEAVLDTVF